MKRLLITLILILVAVYAVFSILGSGGEYAAEKLFYKAMKTYSKITANPDVAPPAMLTSVENGLKSLIKKYPKTSVAKTAHISLSELYIMSKKYEDAQSMLKSIMAAYKDDILVMSMAQFMKGTIYEKTNRWDKALVEFRILRDKYPNTQLGLQIPLYIGKYYQVKGDEAASQDAYKEAVSFYSKIEKENSKKVLGYMASQLLMQSYMNLRNFEEAGNVLEATLMNYASPGSFNQLLPLVEMIYVEKLKSPEKAIALYKKVETLFKGGKLKTIINKRIEILEKSKK